MAQQVEHEQEEFKNGSAAWASNLCYLLDELLILDWVTESTSADMRQQLQAVFGGGTLRPSRYWWPRYTRPQLGTPAWAWFPTTATPKELIEAREGRVLAAWWMVHLCGRW